jgi:hypothetical protein
VLGDSAFPVRLLQGEYFQLSPLLSFCYIYSHAFLTQAATNTFTDNVCRQVVERHIIQQLPNVFNISTIIKLSDDVVQRIAAEPDTRKETKESLANFERILVETLDDLHAIY